MGISHASVRREVTPRAAPWFPESVSDLLVRIVELVTGVFHGRPEPRRFSVLGDDYERREGRRAAIWVFSILTVLFLAGWWVWRQLTL